MHYLIDGYNLLHQVGLLSARRFAHVFRRYADIAVMVQRQEALPIPMTAPAELLP